MKEPVDKKLRSKIRQVFDDFEEPGADAGWKELRKKFPANKRKPLFFWLGSAAAVLLLGTGLWFFDQNSNSETQALTRKPIKNEKLIVQEKKIEKSNHQRDTHSFFKQELPQGSPAKTNSSTNPIVIYQPSEIIRQSGDTAQIIEPALAATHPILQTEKTPDNISAKATQNTEKIAIKKVEENTPAQFLQPKSAAMKDQNTSQNNAAKKNKKEQKMAYSVFAGTYLNYSRGSENKMNFGAGFISDIRLSKNLKLSTGLSLASNSLSYNNNKLPENASASLNSADVSKGNPFITKSISGYTADLLMLDIPINIKYQFVPESDKFYVSGGLSSGTYLAETYKYEYRNFNSSAGSFDNRTQDQKIKKQLNDFDLGRTLNLSLGLSTGFGKTQTISIEPFVKYPLGGLGSENLRFGSTGINLRLHFKPAKN